LHDVSSVLVFLFDFFSFFSTKGKKKEKRREEGKKEGKKGNSMRKPSHA